MAKQKLMIDMDDVITYGGFLYLINIYLGTSYKEEDFSEYYMQDIIPEDRKIDFFNWFIDQNMYEKCKIFDDCYDVLKELNEEYDLYIGTSYIFKEITRNSGHILSQKYDFLTKTFPFIDPNRFIFIQNKELLDMDIKIDDKASNLKNCKRKLLFTAFHNCNISNCELDKNGMERVNNWNEIRIKLKK